MKRFIALLTLILAGASLIVPTLAFADREQESSRRNLRDEANKHAQNGRWEGVQSAYKKLLRLKKVSMCYQDYYIGALVGRELDGADKMLTRLWGAQARLNNVPKDCNTPSRADGLKQELKDWISAEQDSYGYVKIKAKKGTELTWTDAPFAREVRNAGETAFAAIKKKRKFTGLLPVGDYKVSDGSTITVKKTDWKKSKDCVRKIQKKNRPKFSSCFKKAKAQKFKIKGKKAKKKKFRFPWQKKKK
ncbi:MAG: hypothetical protein ACPGQS_09115 [Bradymonadia bacterium]